MSDVQLEQLVRYMGGLPGWERGQVQDGFPEGSGGIFLPGGIPASQLKGRAQALGTPRRRGTLSPLPLSSGSHGERFGEAGTLAGLPKEADSSGLALLCVERKNAQ